MTITRTLVRRPADCQIENLACFSSSNVSIDNELVLDNYKIPKKDIVCGKVIPNRFRGVKIVSKSEGDGEVSQ